jgi:alpha-beta hydrolase superfamily lysophospholipase
MYSQVEIKALDGKKLSANLFESPTVKGGVIFLHMMPATKASYTSLAQKFQELGWEGIAVDFRGHGASEGGPEGYLNFSDQQHQEKYLDISAAVDYLKKHNIGEDKISIIGASIGANLALKYLVQNEVIKTAVLLSPGLNYRGITTKDLVTKLGTGKRVLFVGSEDDNYTKECIEELYGLVPAGVEKQKQIYKDAGHGTTMLERNADCAEIIINFIIK